jgi:hypothetical protein
MLYVSSRLCANCAQRIVHSPITLSFSVRFSRSFLPLLEELSLITTVYRIAFCHENWHAGSQMSGFQTSGFQTSGSQTSGFQTSGSQTSRFSANGAQRNVHSAITLPFSVRFSRSFRPIQGDVWIISAVRVSRCFLLRKLACRRSTKS